MVGAIKLYMKLLLKSESVCLSSVFAISSYSCFCVDQLQMFVQIGRLQIHKFLKVLHGNIGDPRFHLPCRLGAVE